MQVLVVVPTFQEAENIEAVLGGVRRRLPEADVLVVDDGSPDGTAALARLAGTALGRVEVITRPAKRGLGSAYRDGFKWGLERGYDVLVAMDADLSHDPAELPTLVSGLGGGAHLVIGSRYVPGGGIRGWLPHRRALSALGNRYANALLDLKVSDATSGYRAYAAAALRQAGVSSSSASGYAFQIEMVHRVVRAGGTVVEVPIVFTDRRHGRSKISRAVVIEAVLLVTGWGLCERAKSWDGTIGVSAIAPAADAEVRRAGSPG